MNEPKEFELWTTSAVVNLNAGKAFSSFLLSLNEESGVWKIDNKANPETPESFSNLVSIQPYPIKGRPEEILQHVIQATANVLASALKDTDPEKYSGSIEEETAALISRTVV